MGKNTLRNVVQDLCSKANIKGFHTNHSLRATTCSLALGKSVPEKLIMDRTGHRDVREKVVENAKLFLMFYKAPRVHFMRDPPRNVKIEGQQGKFNFNNCTVVFKMN